MPIKQWSYEMTTQWKQNDIPDQNGKVVIVTGGNSGIGYEAALALAGKNAQVILAVRSVDKGEEAAQLIRQRYPQAQVIVMALDLSDLKSVRAFAENFLKQYQRLDVLINNAGVMALPKRKTADGFEMQFGTNHLGHFALTGLLLPVLKATPNGRIVTVSRGVHVSGDIHFDDLQWEKTYDRWGAYAQSKLANLLFAYELQRQLAATGSSLISVGCHPGYAATNLQAAGPQMDGSAVRLWMMNIANAIFAQGQDMGALPTLFAAVAPEVNGCDYIGPTSLGGMRGYPDKVKSNNKSYDEVLAKRLWQVSEELTGVVYDFSQ
jgi:NAD(P)-dependent dehydrogenase (short-subunit alcohol dehydrogenase family)